MLLIYKEQTIFRVIKDLGEQLLVQRVYNDLETSGNMLYVKRDLFINDCKMFR